MTEQDHEQRTIAPDGQPDENQPAWRREFPIDAPRSQYGTRRDFIRFLGLTSLAFAVGQVCILVQNWLRRQHGSPPTAAIATLDQVPVGGAVPFAYPEDHDSCILVRPDEKTLLAYNRKCTHLSCAVVPDVAGKCLNCPCHHGVFDLDTGRPIAGPPRRPLARICLEVRGDTVYATGVELRTV
jgi:Rieske Fe-S protein